MSVQSCEAISEALSKELIGRKLQPTSELLTFHPGQVSSLEDSCNGLGQLCLPCLCILDPENPHWRMRENKFDAKDFAALAVWD
jgi:hypothetical protein